MKLKKRAKGEPGTQPEGGDVVRVLECPECGGHDVVYSWHDGATRINLCKDCGYKGAFVIERKVVVRDEERVEEL